MLFINGQEIKAALQSDNAPSVFEKDAESACNPIIHPALNQKKNQINLLTKHAKKILGQEFGIIARLGRTLFRRTELLNRSF